MDPKSSDINESLIGPSLMAASPPKASPPSVGDDSNATVTFDLPPKSSPSPLQSLPPPPSPSPPPPKDSPSPKALPSPSPPPPSSPPPPKDSSSQFPPSPPPPAKTSAPPPYNDSSHSGTGTSEKSPPPPPPGYSSLVPDNTSAPKKSSSPPLTVFSPPPISKSNRPPPPHSPAVSDSSHGKLNNTKGSSLNSRSGGGDDNSVKYVGAVLAGVFIIALVVAVVLLLLRRRRKRAEVYAAPYFMPPDNLPMTPDGHYSVQQQHGTGNASKDGVYRNVFQNLLGNPDTGPISAQIVFSYDIVMKITNGLSRQNIIGEGGFGYVYKAQLPDGRVAAVKKLKAGSVQGEREFKAEIEIISCVHHRHLVSLVGYCVEEGQRILLYEFVPNKTLDHHLHGRDMPVLDWAKRLKIAIGAAKGLAYLHEDCSQKIIHRDIKSTNILLDDAFEAQVADFGLAKLSDNANTHVSTRVMGTFGYMAPEYATSGKLTDRSDVFSFGVVLLELVTGRKPVDQTQPLGEESLVEWARPLLIHAVETGDCGALVDPRLGNRFVESEMLRMIEAAAACIRHSAPKRPRMTQVVRALDRGGEPFDLSNGVKYGQSIVYDSGQYNEDIKKFRGVNFGSSDNSDMYSGEYSFSREMTGLQHSWVPGSSGAESETRALSGDIVSTGHRNLRESR